jgi:hypothetical protein
MEQQANSIKNMARIGGLLYLIIIVAGIFAQVFVRDKLIVPGDATVTANNIIASELKFRMSFAGSLVMLMCDVAITMIFYVLLKPVSRNLALLAAFFRLVSISVLAINLLNHFAALLPLSDAKYLSAFEPNQLHALASLSLRAFDQGYNISLAFFGVHCLFLGYLLFRSIYFSRILGVLLTITGICYIINSFSWFLVPAFASVIFPGILLPCLVGELSLSLWLLLRNSKHFTQSYQDS